jgi:multiple sugar transport system substrate-binding protein
VLTTPAWELAVRSFSTLLLALVSAALAAACVASPVAQPTAAPPSSAASYLAPLAADKQVSITFENYNLASAGIGRDATLKMLDEFGKQHPNINVETKATSSDNMFPSIQAEVAAGTPPDIAQLVLREWDLNVENLPVKPLTDLIAPDELQQHIAGTYPIHPKAVQLTVRNGKMQGLPYVFSTPTLFYNADLFTAAGLNPDQPPKTWEEVEAAGKQIKERTGNAGLYIACIENDWCAQAVLLSNGARIMSEDRTRIMFGEPAAIEVFQFWQKMVQEGAHAKLSDAEGLDAFQAGKIGMYLQTSAVQGSLLTASAGKWQLRATGMPAFGTKPAVPTNSGSGLAILSADPDKQRAAWELMKFLTSEHAFQIITAEIGYLPLRTGIVNDDKYLKSWVAQNPQILPNIQQMDNLAPSVSYPGQNALQVRKLYLTSFQQVLFDGADAAKTMQDAAARAQELIAQ